MSFAHEIAILVDRRFLCFVLRLFGSFNRGFAAILAILLKITNLANAEDTYKSLLSIWQVFAVLGWHVVFLNHLFLNLLQKCRLLLRFLFLFFLRILRKRLGRCTWRS